MLADKISVREPECSRASTEKQVSKREELEQLIRPSNAVVNNTVICPDMSICVIPTDSRAESDHSNRVVPPAPTHGYKESNI